AGGGGAVRQRKGRGVRRQGGTGQDEAAGDGGGSEKAQGTVHRDLLIYRERCRDTCRAEGCTTRDGPPVRRPVVTACRSYASGGALPMTRKPDPSGYMSDTERVQTCPQSAAPPCPRRGRGAGRAAG